MPFLHNMREDELILDIAPGYDLLFAYKGVVDEWVMVILERGGELFFSPALMGHISDLKKLDLDLFFSDRKLYFFSILRRRG